MSSNNSKSSTTILLGSALGLAVASATYSLMRHKSDKEYSVVVKSSKSLVQGRVSDDGDTEIMSSIDRSFDASDQSITSYNDESSSDEKILVNNDSANTIPRNIQATPRSPSSDLMIDMQPTKSDESRALLATSFMAVVLLAISFVQEHPSLFG